MEGRRFSGRVEERRLLGSSIWLTVQVGGWPGARPGQFALLQAEPSACFLARPLSVAREDGERVSFLIAPVGAGTRELSGLSVGDELWVLGPLGNGFPMDIMLGAPAPGPGPDGGGAGFDRRRLVLVGGGVGVAPLPLLLQGLARAGARADGLAEVLVLLGFRDSAQAEAAVPVLDAVTMLDAAGLSCRGVITTEDGSAGTQGLVTEPLASALLPGDLVAVCGPWAMAEAAWSTCSAAEGVRSWYSLETAMACGVGSCHGCVIALADGSLVRVCAEGPVFAGEKVWGRNAAPGEGEAKR